MAPCAIACEHIGSQATKRFLIVLLKNSIICAERRSQEPVSGFLCRLSFFYSDLVKQKAHIQRKGKNLPTAANIVVAQFDTLIYMVFLRMS